MKKYIGIDIAKKNFVAAIKIQDKIKLKTFTNNDKGFKQLLEWAKELPDEIIHFCMESTGKYGDKLALFLYAHKYIVSVINPAKIKFFMKSQLTRNKTDAVDAKFILTYCESFNPECWQPDPREIQELQELVKRLDVLINMKLQEQNRLENVSEVIRESILSTIEYLKNEIIKMEKRIENHIEIFPHLKEKADLLNSIPGIGDKTTSKIIAFLGNIKSFDKAKQMAALLV
jgi:transposase